MLAAVSRVTRLLLQSLVLGLGAYLVINQEATAGVIIASSILVSRALAPVELSIANWKNFVAARQSRKRLTEMLASVPAEKEPLPLPKPFASLSLESIAARPPGSGRIVLQDINLALQGGNALGIIGPTASGKSSLARLLVGVWEPARERCVWMARHWTNGHRQDFGPHVGYLPQNVDLFSGTIAENIGRFHTELDSDAIILGC